MEVLEQPPVRRGLGVMELVHDHDVEAAGWQTVEVDSGERLHRSEDVSTLVGLLAIDVELTEGSVAQHGAEDVTALGQNLLAVRDEEQPLPTTVLGQPPVVEGGDEGLAGTGGGHDEVLVAAVALALGPQLVEDLDLEGIWAQFEGR